MGGGQNSHKIKIAAHTMGDQMQRNGAKKGEHVPVGVVLQSPSQKLRCARMVLDSSKCLPVEERKEP